MTDNTIRGKLLALCQAYARDRIEHARHALGEAQEGGNEEQKSSVGDKHETGRAMMQLEQEKAGKQLQAAEKLLAVLELIPSQSPSSMVHLGSVVVTDSVSYFISVSAGKLQVGDEEYFAVSAIAPIAQAMLGKSKGDACSFNGKSLQIIEVI